MEDNKISINLSIPFLGILIFGFVIGYFAFDGVAGGLGLAGFLLILELLFLIPVAGYWIAFFLADTPLKTFFGLSGSGELFALIYLVFFVFWIIYTIGLIIVILVIAVASE